jgi:hypothetical protein
VEVCQVEEVFVNYSRVLRVQVGGRGVLTTAEHPLWVWGRGWVPAGSLRPGDLLRSADGQRVPVEAVSDLGEESVVYNLRVSRYHTYFVGDRDWPFSLWAHNTCSDGSASRRARVQAVSRPTSASASRTRPRKETRPSEGQGTVPTTAGPGTEATPGSSGSSASGSLGTARPANACRSASESGDTSGATEHAGAAAKGYPGIKVTANGLGPDFADTPYLKADLGPGQKNVVKIKLTGSRRQDFGEANRQAGFSETPGGYTWHHVPDYDPTNGEATMQLVERGAHQATLPHKGAVYQWEQATGQKYRS